MKNRTIIFVLIIITLLTLLAFAIGDVQSNDNLFPDPVLVDGKIDCDLVDDVFENVLGATKMEFVSTGGALGRGGWPEYPGQENTTLRTHSFPLMPIGSTYSWTDVNYDVMGVVEALGLNLANSPTDGGIWVYREDNSNNSYWFVFKDYERDETGSHNFCGFYKMTSYPNVQHPSDN